MLKRTIESFKKISLVSLAVIFSSFLYGGSSNALSGSEFRAGRIIDDSVFFNSNSMSVAEIQNFLNSKVTCDTNGAKMVGGITRAQYAAQRGWPTTFTCLPQYRENIATKVNNIGSPSTNPAGSISAAQIIYNASAEHGVSSKALIVLLQKEQSLITDEWPVPRQYQIATGYGCPDTAPCDEQYYGFYNQVNRAAFQFKRYVENPSAYRYKAGQVNSIYWSPNLSCGASNVFIENGATAALYNYTPYQPNAAALNNLYGSGDGCSAYGNRNFWRMFRDWFGFTNGFDTNTAHPDGSLVAMDGKVYLIENQQLHHVLSPKIFESRSFKWNEVLPATIGDRSLPVAADMDFMWRGTMYQIGGQGPVYHTIYEDGQWKKQHISLNSFLGLGYRASDVVTVSQREAPAPTSSVVYNLLRHVDGSLIVDGGDVYIIDSGTRRYIGARIFDSHNFGWQKVKPATPLDRSLPIGFRYLYREGSIVLQNNNIYAIDLQPTGVERGLNIGPWECFSDRLGYSSNNLIRTSGINFSSVRFFGCG
jgi:hypothetical protein